jgi:hypothetical protein
MQIQILTQILIPTATAILIQTVTQTQTVIQVPPLKQTPEEVLVNVQHLCVNLMIRHLEAVRPVTAMPIATTAVTAVPMYAMYAVIPGATQLAPEQMVQVAEEGQAVRVMMEIQQR